MYGRGQTWCELRVSLRRVGRAPVTPHPNPRLRPHPPTLLPRPGDHGIVFVTGAQLRGAGTGGHHRRRPSVPCAVYDIIATYPPLPAYGPHPLLQEHNRVVLVQEFATGGDLLRVVYKCGGRLCERQAVNLVLQPFLTALHYLHTQGIVHRWGDAAFFGNLSSGCFGGMGPGTALHHLHRQGIVRRSGTAGMGFGDEALGWGFGGFGGGVDVVHAGNK